MPARQPSLPTRRFTWLLPFTTLLFLVPLAACGSGGGGTDGAAAGADDATSSEKADSSNLDDVRKRVIAWYPIAHSSANPNTRYVGRGIPQQGWAQFVNGVVIPETSSRGINRVMIHNPFGRRRCDTLNGCAPFQFDQYLAAKRVGLDKLTDTFVDAWKPVTQGMDYEVIAYIGSPIKDPDSQKVLDQQGEQAFLERAREATQPFVDTGMMLGFDAAVTAPEDSATFRYAQMTRKAGRKAYVEAGPHADDSYWFDFPVITRDTTWRQRTREDAIRRRRGQEPRFATRDMLNGELLRIVRARGLVPHKWPQEACQIIADGDTLVIEDDLLEDPNRDIQSLADCANDQ